MEYLLFVIYLVLLCWLITRLKFFVRSGLSKAQLISLFLLKILAGIFYGWIGVYYGDLAQMFDTWNYHNLSVQEYKLLRNNPLLFIADLFQSPYEDGYGGFFASKDSYWNDLKGNLFIKIIAIFNLLSTGNYFINVIFFSLITFVGPVALFRVMNDIFPGKKMLLLIATFLIPSFIYWTSGIHKEGLLFTGIALIFYATYYSLKSKNLSLPRLTGLLSGLLILFALRNFLLVLIIPALLTWWLSSFRPSKSLWIYSVCYTLFAIFFFLGSFLSPRLNFPQYVVNKQQEFIKLPGNSSVPIKELEPNAVSFLKSIPQALNLTLARPYPSDVNHILSLAATIETYAILFLLVLFLIYRSQIRFNRPELMFCLFFAFSTLLAIGFSVNNLGAIVRYRSIIIPLLLIPVILHINWQKIHRSYSRIIN